MHEKKKTYECKLCPKTFGTNMTLNFHVSLKHKEREFVCHLCGESFRLGFQLKAHVESKHEGVNKCEICKKSWAGRQSYTEHMKLVHGEIVIRVSNPDSVEKCKICEKLFSKEAIENHIEMEHEKTQHQCDICGLVFNNTLEFNTHAKNVHDYNNINFNLF